jgi:N-acetylmuramoyl-L-alanine amidase
MRRNTALFLPLILAFVVVACATYDTSRICALGVAFPKRPARQVTPDQLLAEARVKLDLIPPGTVGRRYFRPMRPRYITIHSTQNYTGNAYNHALALKRGALRATKRPGGNRIGFLTWHFTVQEDIAIQHLPCREQGEHADFDGPGNNYSIGIEMCEHSGNDIGQTIDRTARLAAYLMRAYDIPLEPRHGALPLAAPGLTPPNKDCPHFLLERGRPGPTWRWFLNRVQFHYNRMLPGAATPLG